MTNRSLLSLPALLVLMFGTAPGAPPTPPPTADLSNGIVAVRMYLPDAKSGFYRGTRFDWSGVIHSLKYQGHEYYGPWFTKTDPNTRDFVYEGDADIVAGPCSAITGPVDEFRPVGWDAVKPGGTFIKIGVGALRKPDGKGSERYDAYRLYEIADGGKWSVRKRSDSVEFTQQLADTESGYAYIYRKTVRLSKGQPEMVLEHSLKNTGSRAIDTTVYNHNFLIMDGRAPGPGLSLAMPFEIQTSRPPNKELAEVRGKQIVYLKKLAGRDVVAMPVQGFGSSPDDHQIRIEDSQQGLGMTIAGDRKLHSAALWSIRSVMAIEPFVAVAVEPGGEFTWKSTYRYYTTGAVK